MNLVVIVPDQRIVKDGVSYQCHFEPHLPNLRVLRWNGDYGTLEGHKIDPPRFTDEAVLTPYLEAWERGKAADEEAKAEEARQKQEEEEKRRKQEEEAKAEADRIAAEEERLRPRNEALMRLHRSDHEVIKAMEARLAAEYLLDEGFVAEREAAREVVRSFKK